MRKNGGTMFRFLAFAFRCHKPYFAYMILNSLAASLTGVLGAYTISLLISFLERGEPRRAVLCGLVIAAAEGALFLLGRFLTAKTDTAAERMEQEVNRQLAGKIMALPFSYLEDAHYVEMKNNAQMGVNNMGAVHLFLRGIMAIFSNLITIFALSAIIVSFNWTLILVLLAGVAFTVLVTLISTKTQINFFRELLPINFKYNYYIDALCSVKNSKDFRLYGTYDVMTGKFEHFCGEMERSFDRIMLKKGALEAAISFIRYAVMGFVYVIVGITTITRRLPISNFSLTVSAAISFSACVSAIIDASDNFIRSIEYVKPVLEFMDIREDADEGEQELNGIDELEFEHVSFTYPHTDKKVLDDVSFCIRKNEKISIVGLNGAGKTTIVKLICRLYRPDSGRIKINGTDIFDYSYASYMRGISAVFQDYKLFHYSILENISPDIDGKKGLELAEAVGLREKLDTLPRGINSCLGKEYEEDGTELSGGQMQKIAIARALCKPAGLLILDEPTSALDPIAEAEIYEHFNSLAQDRTALYISHRMSSSIFCDRILVLNGGRVEDFAPHRELMEKRDSLYYRLFMTQAENYRGTPAEA